MSALAVKMTNDFAHVPVMLAAVVDRIRRCPSPRLLVDATAGGGGHAAALLAAFPAAELIAIDRDPEAVAATVARLAPFGARARVLHSRFSELPALLASLGRQGIDGLVADLGVSSVQLDNRERGFSFRQAGPLDMRMDPTSGQNAEELLSTIREVELAVAIKSLGEERFAKRVARAIKRAAPTDTASLAEAVRGALPKKPGRARIDPATRTFQAIRMLLNRELDELQTLLADLPDLLADHGVAVFIAFHSLEDRAVKRALRAGAKGCSCPPAAPVCVCGGSPTFELLHRRPLQPLPEEVTQNPRARSAKLRAAQRLPRRR